jgi:hypothetical protein
MFHYPASPQPLTHTTDLRLVLGRERPASVLHGVSAAGDGGLGLGAERRMQAGLVWCTTSKTERARAIGWSAIMPCAPGRSMQARHATRAARRRPLLPLPPPSPSPTHPTCSQQSSSFRLASAEKVVPTTSACSSFSSPFSLFLFFGV